MRDSDRGTLGTRCLILIQYHLAPAAYNLHAVTDALPVPQFGTLAALSHYLTFPILKIVAGVPDKDKLNVYAPLMLVCGGTR
jgi:hypothetical protein